MCGSAFGMSETPFPGSGGRQSSGGRLLIAPESSAQPRMIGVRWDRCRDGLRTSVSAIETLHPTVSGRFPPEGRLAALLLKAIGMDHDGQAGGGNLRYRAKPSTSGSASPMRGHAGRRHDRLGLSDPDVRPSIVDGATLLETEQVLLKVAPVLLAHTTCIRREGRVDTFVSGTRTGFRQYDASICGDAVEEIVTALEAALAQNRRSAVLQELVVKWRRIPKDMEKP
jgi:hypothetical protein